MDVRGFVYHLVDLVPGFLRQPARWIADRVFGIWDDVSQVFRLARPSWLRLGGRLWDYIRSAYYIIGELAVTARWIVTVKIPAIVRSITSSILNWTVARLNEFRVWALGTINTVRDFLNRAINRALSLIDTLRRFVIDQLRTILHTLDIVARRVFDLLTDPAKLATWLVGAMFGALIRYVGDHIDPIVDFLWARRQRLIVQAVARIEVVLARIL